MTVTIEEQLAVVRREIAMRKSAYPKWIASKRMTQQKADDEIAAMQAVHDTLTVMKDARQIMVDLALWTEPGELKSAMTRLLARIDGVPVPAGCEKR